MRHAHLFPIICLTLSACVFFKADADDDDDDDDDGGSDSGIWDGGTGGGTGGGSGEPCDTELSPSSPTAGQADFYHRSPLVVDLWGGTGAETLELSSASGAAVSGSTSSDGQTLTFTPDAPLSPSSEYTATVQFCGSQVAEYSFATSALGTPTSGCSVTGRTYTVDLSGARFVQPAGVGELLLGQLDEDFLFSATSQTSSRIEWISGMGQGGSQDECSETVEWPRTDWSDPHFTVGPQDTSLSFQGLELTIDDLYFSATVASDCASYGGGVMTGELDARVTAPLMGELLGTTDPDEFCGFMASFGVECDPCSDGQEYCVAIEVRDIEATGRSGAIEEISSRDVAENPSCE